MGVLLESPSAERAGGGASAAPLECGLPPTASVRSKRTAPCFWTELLAAPHESNPVRICAPLGMTPSDYKADGPLCPASPTIRSAAALTGSLATRDNGRSCRAAHNPHKSSETATVRYRYSSVHRQQNTGR